MITPTCSSMSMGNMAGYITPSVVICEDVRMSWRSITIHDRNTIAPHDDAVQQKMQAPAGSSAHGP